MNKKGASIDNIWVAISFFGLAIFFIAMIIVWNSLAGLTDEIWSQSPTAATIKNNTQDAVDMFDFILVLVYFGLHLGIIVLAYLLRTHPIIYVVAIILIAVIGILGAELSNAYTNFIDDSEVAAAAADIPITNHILENFPKYEIVWGFITAIVLFGIARFEGIV